MPQPPPLGLRLTRPNKRGPSKPDPNKASQPQKGPQPEGRPILPARYEPVADPETIVWGGFRRGLAGRHPVAAVTRTTSSAKRSRPRSTSEAPTRHDAIVEYLHHTAFDFTEIRDAEGRSIDSLLIITGPKFNTTMTLPAGQPVLIGPAQFEVHSIHNGIQHSPLVIAPAGKYRYSTWLHIGRSDLADVGIRLATGELPLELTANLDESSESNAEMDADQATNQAGDDRNRMR